jgi:hypothetical protein
MATPSRRPLDFRSFEDLSADVARLQTGGYERVGVWSLEQVLDHLTKSMVLARSTSEGLPRPVRWLMKPIVWRLLRTRQMPTVPAPKRLRPLPTIEPGVEARFASEVEVARSMTGDRIDHPAFGWMRVEDWKQLQLIHAARHLSFLVPR